MTVRIVTKSPRCVAGSLSPGIRSRVRARMRKKGWLMAMASSLMKKHIPRANHMPARVAMKGWTLR